MDKELLNYFLLIYIPFIPLRWLAKKYPLTDTMIFYNWLIVIGFIFFLIFGSIFFNSPAFIGVVTFIFYFSIYNVFLHDFKAKHAQAARNNGFAVIFLILHCLVGFSCIMIVIQA